MTLYEFIVAYFKEARDDNLIDAGISDAVIEREARKMAARYPLRIGFTVPIKELESDMPDHAEKQPYPSTKACVHADFMAEGGHDPRLGCWFCGNPSVALAGRHSGGDVDVPAHWLPVCDKHLEGWFDDLPTDEERLPILKLES
jgi:hypothetical protein